MKVILLNSLAKDTGSWLRLNYLAKSLRDNNYEVEIIEPFEKTLPFILDVPLSFFKYLKILFKKGDVFFGLKPYPNVTIPLLLKKLLGNKIIVDIDDLDYGYRKGIIAFVSKLVQRPLPKFFDLVTYHTDSLREHIIRDLNVKEEKLYRLDQGVDLSVFDYKIKDRELRKKFKEKYILVYTGHLNIASDLDDIFRAFKLVLEKEKNIVLIVAGGGPMENEFKKMAKNLNVYFTGQLKKEDIARYLSIADACLVYYKDRLVNYYRSSMKIRECLAMGKKVVCDDIGDLGLFKDYTFQSKADLRDFSEKILIALRSKIDNKGRKFIEKNYSWNKIGKEFGEKLENFKR